LECELRINPKYWKWPNLVAAAVVVVGVGWGGGDDDVVVGTGVDLAVLFGADIDPNVDAVLVVVSKCYLLLSNCLCRDEKIN
jgi:hypothetical protein